LSSGWTARFAVRDAAIRQPDVHLVVALEPQPGCEEALAHQPDLILDLPLLQARRRRACHRIDQVMPAHLQEAPIILAPAAEEAVFMFICATFTVVVTPPMTTISWLLSN
jgi:hypothetical protein